MSATRIETMKENGASSEHIEASEKIRKFHIVVRAELAVDDVQAIEFAVAESMPAFAKAEDFRNLFGRRFDAAVAIYAARIITDPKP
jgi:DNA gyrase inhibitor GyrI